MKASEAFRSRPLGMCPTEPLPPRVTSNAAAPAQVYAPGDVRRTARPESHAPESAERAGRADGTGRTGFAFPGSPLHTLRSPGPPIPPPHGIGEFDGTDATPSRISSRVRVARISTGALPRRSSRQTIRPNLPAIRVREIPERMRPPPGGRRA